MSMVSGVFQYNSEAGLQEVQEAMRFLKYCGRLKSAGAGKHPHAYHELTFRQGHTESFSGLVTKDMWNYFLPQRLEVFLVDDMSSNRKDMGRVVVYDANGAKQPFEMSEALYQVVDERIAEDKVRYKMPTGGMKLVVG